MHLLEGLEFHEKGIEGFEEFCRGRRVEVEDCREGEAEQEVVCCAAGEFAGVEEGHSLEVWFVE